MSPDYENLELHTVEAEPPAVDRGLVTWLTIAIAIVAGAAIAALLLATSRAAPGPTSTAPAQPEALPVTAPSVAAAAHPVVATVQAAGTASWYCSTSSACTRGYPASGLFAAAGSEIRAWRGELVRVRSGGRSVVVRLIDVCGCPGRRVIDLYASAFRRLAPTSRGLIPVTVTLERALLLPPTDTAGPGV